MIEWENALIQTNHQPLYVNIPEIVCDKISFTSRGCNQKYRTPLNNKHQTSFLINFTNNEMKW